MKDITEFVSNWQFCDKVDGEIGYFQDGIPQVLVANYWGPVEYVDNAPILDFSPPVYGYRPEFTIVNIFTLPGGLGSKFAQAPPNPGEYNHVVKVHKGSAGFYFEYPKTVEYSFKKGVEYTVKTWVFPDFYDNATDPWGEFFIVKAEGFEESMWWVHEDLALDQWHELEYKFIPQEDMDSVKISLCGGSKHGLKGNTWWLHGMRLYEDDSTPPVPPVPPGTVEVEFGAMTRGFLHDEIGRLVEAIESLKV